MQMLIRLMLERDPLKRPLAAQVLSYLSKSSILTAQIPEFSSHIKYPKQESGQVQWKWGPLIKKHIM